MANMNTWYQTEMANWSTSNSNVPYKLRVYYRTTSRTANAVTIQFDVAVLYPSTSPGAQWSSNGAWVRMDKNSGIAVRTNTNAFTWQYVFYASTKEQPRGANSVWRTATFSVPATTTAVGVFVGFSNTAWAAANFTDHQFHIEIPASTTGGGGGGDGGGGVVIPPYDSIGAPTGLNINQNTSSHWMNRNSSPFISWNAASGGRNNPVKDYVVELYCNSSSTFSTSNMIASETLGSNRTTWTGPNLNGQTEGNYLWVRITARPTQGNTTRAIQNSFAVRINISPSQPSISSPNPLDVIGVNSSVVINEVTDNGGINPSQGSLNYRISFGGNQTAWSTSRTINPSFAAFAGRSVSIFPTVSDGWVTRDGGAVNVHVGSSITAYPPTYNTSNLIASTVLQIPRVWINGVASTNNESILIQLSWNNSAWETIATSSRSAANTASTISISNIFATIYNRAPTQFNNNGNRRVYFRTVHTIGHLSTNSGSSSIEYIQPTVSSGITHADNLTTFKFPMNNTIPVTEHSVSIRSSVGSWSSGNTGALLIRARRTGTTSWTTIFSRTLSSNLSDSTSIYTLSAGTTLPLNFGDIAELSYSLVISSGGSNIEVAFGNINWNIPNQLNGDRNKVERRALPQITFTQHSNQLSFIRNGYSDNTISLPYTLSWPLSRAFVLTEAYIILNGYRIDAESLPRLLFSTTNPSLDFITPLVRLETEINNDKSWNIKEAIVTDETAPVSAPQGAKIIGNGNTIVTRVFVAKEVFRSTPTADAPITNLLSLNSATVTHNYTANTFCLPQFYDGDIDYERADGIWPDMVDDEGNIIIPESPAPIIEFNPNFDNYNDNWPIVPLGINVVTSDKNEIEYPIYWGVFDQDPRELYSDEEIMNILAYDYESDNVVISGRLHSLELSASRNIGNGYYTVVIFNSPTKYTVGVQYIDTFSTERENILVSFAGYSNGTTLFSEGIYSLSFNINTIETPSIIIYEVRNIETGMSYTSDSMPYSQLQPIIFSFDAELPSGEYTMEVIAFDDMFIEIGKGEFYFKID